MQDTILSENRQVTFRREASVAAGNTGKGRSLPAVSVNESISWAGWPVQRVMVTPGVPLANGQKIEDILSGLGDTALTRGDKMDLVVEFGVTKDSHAATSLCMDGEVVVPQEVLTPANKDKRWVIKIVLSEEMYGAGSKREALGDLYQTLVHEWELHGRQHALNIDKLKKGEAPDVLFDHGVFFEKDTGLDRGIAKVKQDEKELASAIDESHKKDIDHHRRLNLEGWEGENKDKARDFMTILIPIRDSFNMLKTIKPVTAEQKKYENFLFQFFGVAFKSDFFKTINEDNLSVEYMSYELGGTPREAYSILIRMYTEEIPGAEDDMYKVSREQIKERFNSLLLRFPPFVAACTTINS